jgi:cytoskeleton protein RodZ
MPKLDRDERGINMPFDASSMQYGNSILSFVSRPAGLWVIGLLMAALLVVYFPEVHTASQAVIAPVSTTNTPPPNIPETTPAAISLPATSATEVAIAPASSPAVAAPTPVKAVSEAVAVAPAAVTAPAQEHVSPGDLLVFKAKSTAWVRVSDFKGAVQFEKTLAAGETATASGALPLTIVVGNVSGTELMVRGKAFNLEEVAKNNVARFEVK